MNIWHKPDEKPTQRRWIVVKYRAPVKPTCKFVEKDTYISPVCDYAYVNDLVQDYNRTRKALDVAVDALKRIDETRSGVKENLHATNGRTLNAGNGFCWATIDDIHNALEQITALEQKENKI